MEEEEEEEEEKKKKLLEVVVEMEMKEEEEAEEIVDLPSTDRRKSWGLWPSRRQTREEEVSKKTEAFKTEVITATTVEPPL